MSALIFFFVLLFLPLSASAFKLPSTVSLSQSIDNDNNQSTAFDVSLATPIKVMVSAGVLYSQLDFGEGEKGKNTNYYLALQSNPLRDWVFGSEISHTAVSEQMVIYDPSVSVQHFSKYLSVRLDLGYRMITGKVTSSLGAILGIEEEELEDNNIWWGLSLDVFLKKDFFFRVSVKDFNYSQPFQFFNRSTAPSVLGYTYDTINFGASLANYAFSMGGYYFRKNWDFSLDFSFVDQAFSGAKNYTWTPAIGYRASKSWYLNLGVGFNFGTIEEQTNSVQGQMANFGITYSW